MIRLLLKIFCLLFAAAIITACQQERPKNIANACSLFKQYPTWYWASEAVYRQYGLPMSVQLAIIHQESHFRPQAKPPRTKLLGIIPWLRPSSAYGYAQITDGSWRFYKKKTKRLLAHRDLFEGAITYIGWFYQQVHKRFHIAPYHAQQFYLIYHEGIQGYQHKSYQRKPWLIKVSRKVRRQSIIYHEQLLACLKTLPKKPWWRFW